ncbi:MAG: ABC transporter ATP-binding protein/permease [Sediminibacterium sp.]|jgi:ABC-type bacteriocin/lantibiotic exporter with double-glycine peptidase domain|nr:ABC transporter ATP-binding protein/permease [Sediminibacterium sp.]
MAKIYNDISLRESLNKFIKIIRLEKKEVTAIYFYAVLSGVIQLTLPLGIQTIINFSQAAAGTANLPVSIILLIFIVLIGILVSGILQVNQMKIVEKIEQSIFTRFSLDFANKIPKIDSKELNNDHLPELMNRFFEVINLQKGLSKILLDIPLAVIQIVFGLVLLSFYNSTFIILGLLLILLLYFIFNYTSKKGLIASYNESENKYEVASWLEEIARSYKTFKISSQNNFHLKRTDDLVKDYLVSKTKHFEILKFQYWSLIVFKLLISAMMLIIGAVLLINQQLNIGQFIAAEIVILLILSAVEKLILNLEVAYNILTGVEKLNVINDKKSEVLGQTSFVSNHNGIALEVQNLNFKFDENKPLLENISFNIPAGAKVCVMGDGGAGKSILLELIGGTLKNFEGVINVNTIPINNLNQKEYRKNIGIFYNEQDIFEGTLYENICMGNESITPADIMKHAEMLEIKEFISLLPEGLYTPLQPTGKGLSTIMAKKILLLRAIVHQPELLVLDEPFELAGAESSKKISKYLIDIPNTTCMIVSGYIPFAKRADLIIWLEKGKIKHFGKPETILPLVIS